MIYTYTQIGNSCLKIKVCLKLKAYR